MGLPALAVSFTAPAVFRSTPPRAGKSINQSIDRSINRSINQTINCLLAYCQHTNYASVTNDAGIVYGSMVYSFQTGFKEIVRLCGIRHMCSQIARCPYGILLIYDIQTTEKSYDNLTPAQDL